VENVLYRGNDFLAASGVHINRMLTPVDQLVPKGGSLRPPPHACSVREISSPNPSCVPAVDSNHLLTLSKAAATRYFSKMSQEFFNHPSELAPNHTSQIAWNTVMPTNEITGSSRDEPQPMANEHEGFERSNTARTEHQREGLGQSAPGMQILKENESIEVSTAPNDGAQRCSDLDKSLS
jgi:hypothetical protein